LLGTIALSALTAIGLTNLVYSTILGYPLFEIVPIFAFVFLVSLGEDFNILTIARIREEVTTLGPRRPCAPPPWRARAAWSPPVAWSWPRASYA